MKKKTSLLTKKRIRALWMFRLRAALLLLIMAVIAWFSWLSPSARRVRTARVQEIGK